MGNFTGKIFEIWILRIFEREFDVEFFAGIWAEFLKYSCEFLGIFLIRTSRKIDLAAFFAKKEKYSHNQTQIRIISFHSPAFHPHFNPDSPKNLNLINVCTNFSSFNYSFYSCMPKLCEVVNNLALERTTFIHNLRYSRTQHKKLHTEKVLSKVIEAHQNQGLKMYGLDHLTTPKFSFLLFDFVIH